MTKSERLAEKLKADRAARRHLEYVEKLRSDRAEQAATKKRIEQHREQRLSEQQEIQRKIEVAGQVAEALRAQQAERRLAEQRALKEDRPRRGEQRKRLAPRRPEKHQQLGNVTETARQRSGALRQRQVEQRRTDRTALDQQRAKRVQIQEELGARRVEQHRQLRTAAETAHQRSGALRQRQVEQRRTDRTALDQQRAKRVQIQEQLGARRVKQHRQLQEVAGASKRRDGALRAREVARRAREGKTTVARAPAVRSAEIRARAALVSPASPPEEPQDNLLWLRTADAFIVDENGAAVSLRGITVQGLDTAAPVPNQSLAATISLDDANCSMISDLWGINLVRLPFKAQTVLSGNASLSPDDLLAGLDDIVAALGQLGIYTLLSLQAPVPQDATAAPLPDQSAFDCWGILAQHYQDEPAVLFEIFSSPRPISGDWFQAAQILIGFIRRQNPASLLFVGNGSGTVDTSRLPLRFTTGDPTPNIVNTIQVASQTQFSTSDENLLASLAQSFPVFASDWSSGAFEFDRSAEFAANLFSRYGIGWAASNWNGEPRLVTNSNGHDFSPTRWGLAVQRAMMLPKKEPLTMLLPDGGKR